MTWHWIAAALLAALLGATPTATAAVQVNGLQATSFVPAQAEGHLEVLDAQFVLILIHGTPVSAKTDLGRSDVRNQTWQEFNDGDSGRLPAPLPISSATLPGIQGRLESATSWSCLYIEAALIRLEVPNATANLLQAKKGLPVSDSFPTTLDYPRSAVDQPSISVPGYRHLLVPERSMVFSLQGTPLGDTIPFTLNATGVTRVALHNITLSCAPACLTPGAPAGATLAALGEPWVRQLSYINIDSTTGHLEGSGSALAIVAGASVLDATLNGTLRLPDATLSDPCPPGACLEDPAGKTFRPQGEFLLSGLAPAPSDPTRLETQVSGRIDNAYYDELPAPGFAVAQTLSVGTVLVVGGGCLVALGLFARSARLPALQHPRRQALHHLIQEEPGLSSRSLQRRLGWSRGTLLFHLKRLVEEGHVAAQPYKNTVRYFENHGRYADAWRKVVELRDPDASRLHEWLLAHSGVDQTGIVEETLGWGWDRNKVRRQLRNLQQAGLVEKQPAGRRVCYSA
ncbi:MAG: winged helix-turn-helix transcriptional regulator, partial [Thermoplasmatota archaeon]